MQGHRSCEGITVIYVQVGEYCCVTRCSVIAVSFGHSKPLLRLQALHRQMRVHRSDREHPELLLQLLVPTAASADASLSL